jgi:hypothetical protein
MTINIGGQQFTEEQVIAAIAASNDPVTPAAIAPYTSIDEVSSVLQAVLHRLAALEDRLPTTHSGFGVTKTVKDGYNCYRVQMLDQNGNTQIVKFELPITSSY